MDNNLEGEKVEMVQLYESQGLTHEDATRVIDILSKYPDVFLDTMMNVELGLQPVESGNAPWKNGLVTFVAFEVFGFIPLISYLVFETANTGAFVLAIILTALTLMALGAAKAQFIGQNKVRRAARAHAPRERARARRCSGACRLPARLASSWTIAFPDPVVPTDTGQVRVLHARERQRRGWRGVLRRLGAQ